MKLKCYFAIVFSMLVLFTFCAISQAEDAAQVSYRGTFDTWFYMDGSQATNAKAVDSSWQMGLTRGEKAWFYAHYLELNVAEEIPGTYDNFTIIMVTDNWESIGNGYFLEGTSFFWKNGVLTYQFDAQITIDSEFYVTQLRANFTIDQENIVQIFGSLLP